MIPQCPLNFSLAILFNSADVRFISILSILFMKGSISHSFSFDKSKQNRYTAKKDINIYSKDDLYYA